MAKIPTKLTITLLLSLEFIHQEKTEAEVEEETEVISGEKEEEETEAGEEAEEDEEILFNLYPYNL